MIEGKILYDYAMSFVGLPYRWGGDDPMEGFDCSGLAIELLQAQGKFPHGQDSTAQGLYDRFKDKKWNVPTFRCLAFFGRGTNVITHVAFCLDGLSMLEAGGGRASTTSKEAAIAQNAFIRVRPIESRKDLVGFVFP